MTRYSLSVLLVASLTACSDPAPTPTDVPQTDTGGDTGAPVDSAMDVGDSTPQDSATTDSGAPTDAGDVPTDVQFGMPWCDLPVPAGMEVRGATVPEGFCIRRYYLARVDEMAPRVIQFAPNGDLFVASPSTPTPGGASPGRGEIVILPDENRDGIADRAIVYANSLDSVHGLLFTRDSLYYTLDDGVYRWPYTTGDRRAPTTPATQLADLFDREGANRWTHTLTQDSRGEILVSRGVYDSSTCPNPNPRSGSVLRVGPGHDMRGDIVARGFRNPMFIRCQAWGTCYGAELSGDGWGGLGAEKIFEITEGSDMGYPCCYDRDRPVMPAWASHCTNVVQQISGYPIGDTPFGHDFEKGLWPEPYRGGLFVALHGVVGSWLHTGVTWAPTDPATHRPTRTPQVFVSGFALAGPIVGRPCDLVFAPDGRMFFTDDTGSTSAGRGIYWVAPRTLRVRLP